MYKAESQNTAIFIDYENVYITLTEQYTSITDAQFTIIDKIRERYRNCAIKTLKLFCDFSTIKDSIQGLDTKFVELQHVSSIDRSSRHKNACDIAMSVDITKSMIQRPDITRYVVVSSDSDMLPIINELVKHGKIVDVICFKSSSTSFVYQQVLSSWGINCYMIEDMLQLIQFEKMTWEDFNRNIFKIKDDIRRFYIDYKELNPTRIPSMRDVKQGLEKMGYCKEDCSDIIKYGLQSEVSPIRARVLEYRNYVTITVSLEKNDSR